MHLGDIGQCSQVRSAVADELTANCNHYQSFVCGDWKQYVAGVRDASWGDNVTLLAAANKYLLSITLLTDYDDNPIIKVEPLEEEGAHREQLKPLVLTFQSELHYNGTQHAAPRSTQQQQATPTHLANGSGNGAADVDGCHDIAHTTGRPKAPPGQGDQHAQGRPVDWALKLEHTFKTPVPAAATLKQSPPETQMVTQFHASLGDGFLLWVCPACIGCEMQAVTPSSPGVFPSLDGLARHMRAKIGRGHTHMAELHEFITVHMRDLTSDPQASQTLKEHIHRVKELKRETRQGDAITTSTSRANTEAATDVATVAAVANDTSHATSTETTHVPPTVADTAAVDSPEESTALQPIANELTTCGIDVAEGAHIADTKSTHSRQHASTAVATHGARGACKPESVAPLQIQPNSLVMQQVTGGSESSDSHEVVDKGGGGCAVVEGVDRVDGVSCDPHLCAFVTYFIPN